ncbi:MAG: F0F1 ATP synthase subunit A [Dehalococcoidales bacterium]|nr:F0F1 ATP synthase subunit A [Dehalococcoidales bacterium]
MPKIGCFGCSINLGILLVVLALFVIAFISGALGSAFIGDTSIGEAVAIEAPHIQLPGEVIFHIGSFGVTNTLLTSWISIIVLVLISWAVTHKIKLIPSRMQALLESALEWMLNFCIEVAGEKNGRRFFPLVTTIFLFVLMNAWMNLIPGYGSILLHTGHGHSVHLLRGANTDINFPLAVALISFVFVFYHGFRALGPGFLKVFFNFGRFFQGHKKLFTGKVKAGFGDIGMGAIDIFVGLLELISYIFRIVSFTFRLFGNMTGGEVLILVMIFLIPWILAIPFYGLELLVGTIQALVFAGLTLVFATVAITPHESEEH